MTKIKKRNSLIALALVAVLAIGGTLAYLTATTADKTNTFTMGKGISGTTEEPKWEETGKTDAEKFVPGKVIAKDPRIVNTSDVNAGAVYVAATIKYQVKGANNTDWVDGDFADLDRFINIKHGTPLVDGFNTTNWTMANDNTIAYYKTTLAPNEAKNAATATIFDAIEIDPLALTPDQVASGESTNPQFDKSKYIDGNGNIYTTYQMKDFQIVVKGYLVQSEGFTDVQTAMSTAFPEVF